MNAPISLFLSKATDEALLLGRLDKLGVRAHSSPELALLCAQKNQPQAFKLVCETISRANKLRLGNDLLCSLFAQGHNSFALSAAPLAADHELSKAFEFLAKDSSLDAPLRPALASLAPIIKKRYPGHSFQWQETLLMACAKDARLLALFPKSFHKRETALSALSLAASQRPEDEWINLSAYFGPGVFRSESGKNQKRKNAIASHCAEQAACRNFSAPSFLFFKSHIAQFPELFFKTVELAASLGSTRSLLGLQQAGFPFPLHALARGNLASLAIGRKHMDCAKILIERIGCSIEAIAPKSKSLNHLVFDNALLDRPLSVALWNKDCAMVEFLLAKGASIEASAKGLSPIDLSCRLRFPEGLEILARHGAFERKHPMGALLCAQAEGDDLESAWKIFDLLLRENHGSFIISPMGNQPSALEQFKRSAAQDRAKSLHGFPGAQPHDSHFDERARALEEACLISSCAAAPSASAERTGPRL